jgi:hypothetical protein
VYSSSATKPMHRHTTTTIVMVANDNKTLTKKNAKVMYLL